MGSISTALKGEGISGRGEPSMFYGSIFILALSLGVETIFPTFGSLALSSLDSISCIFFLKKQQPIAL
jgi:hypothetical protein